MKLLIKFSAIICLVASLTLVLCSCRSYSGYKGDYPGAYTLAYTQIPDTLGATRKTTRFRDPQILLLERDSYDRGLYIYFESTDKPLSVLVVQKENNERVWFYPEKSTISFKTPDSIYDIRDKKLSKEKLTELYRELCSNDDLANLKEINDWNKPIDESLLESADITRPALSGPWSFRKDKVNLKDEVWKEEIFGVATKNGHNIPSEYISGYHGTNVYENWMATDTYGRRLYYVECSYYVYNEDPTSNVLNTEYFLEMIAILMPDESYNKDTFMVELKDKTNYQEQMRELKVANGWNTPLNSTAGG